MDIIDDIITRKEKEDSKKIKRMVSVSNLSSYGEGSQKAGNIPR